MAAESPIALIYGSDGATYIETSIRAGIAVPAGQPGFLALGSDGTNARYMRMASDGTLRVDPTGTTPQPVTQSGTWTVQQGTPPWSVSQSGTWNIADITGTISLPTGAATESTLTTLLTTSAFQARIPVNGQAVMSASIPVVIASNQSVLPINDNSGSLTVDSPQLPSSLVGGRLDINVGAINNVTPLMGNGVTGTGSQRVTIASDNTPFGVKVTDGMNFLPTGDIVGRSIFHQISDGTTGPVAVKAASTAPAATDKAMVVVISPNQQAIPTTTAAANAVTGQSWGRFLNGSAGVTRAVRQTTYTEQTTNFTGSVKSASANDTSAGTGARTLRITYFDQTGAGPYTEDVTLNGTTAVDLVNSNHCFIEKMEVLTAGSAGSNQGVVTLYASTGGTGTVVGSIGYETVTSGAGDNQTFWAHHYVPLNKTASIYNTGGGTTGNQIGIMFLRAAYPLTANSTDLQVSDTLTIPNNGPFSTRTLANPIRVAGFARITAYITSNGSNTNYFVAFDYSEVAS